MSDFKISISKSIFTLLKIKNANVSIALLALFFLELTIATLPWLFCTLIKFNLCHKFYETAKKISERFYMSFFLVFWKIVAVFNYYCTQN